MHCETGWVQGHVPLCTLHFALCTAWHRAVGGRRRRPTTTTTSHKAACKVQHGQNMGNPMRGGTGTSLMPRRCAARSFALLAFMKLGGNNLRRGGEGRRGVVAISIGLQDGVEGTQRSGNPEWFPIPTPYPPAGSEGRHSTLAWIPNSNGAILVLAKSSLPPHPRIFSRKSPSS